MTEDVTFKLSDIPFFEISSQPDWLISATGELGMILKIDIIPDGIHFGVHLDILWVSGKRSNPAWPYECDKVTVNPAKLNRINKGYVEGHVKICNKNIEYLRLLENK